jgi:hypothetical protein
VNSPVPTNSSVTQSIFVLCTLPFRFIKNTLLPSASSIKPAVHFDTSAPVGSNHMYDLYIASGDHDECWLNTFAVPLLEEINMSYTKRQSYYDNDQLDALCDIHVRKRSRVLYYLINDNERLSHLATELAFLIGERKHHIIVYLQPTIDENSSEIVNKIERQDIERSRKYLEDLARKENISLSHTREQSWQHVLAFLLPE